MSTKKQEDKVEAAVQDTQEVKEPEAAFDVESFKEQIKAELKAEVRAEVEAELKKEDKKTEAVGETAAQKKRAEEKVELFIPYVEGKGNEVNITLNGETTQIMRGQKVMVPRKIAEIWEHSQQQDTYAARMREGYQLNE